MRRCRRVILKVESDSKIIAFKCRCLSHIIYKRNIQKFIFKNLDTDRFRKLNNRETECLNQNSYIEHSVNGRNILKG